MRRQPCGGENRDYDECDNGVAAHSATSSAPDEQVSARSTTRGKQAPHNDLLTGRTVGLLELCSFLPDCTHFVLREQTLQLDVLNGIG